MAAVVEELPRYLTVDDEIAQASHDRAREGGHLLARQFLERLAEAGQSAAWHLVFTIKDRPGIDAGNMSGEDFRCEFVTWLHKVNAAVSPIGKNYRRQYGHSFCAYLVGPDWGGRTGRGHGHGITTDLPLFIAKRYWNPGFRGTLWARRIHPGNLIERVEYVAYEACKGGDPHMWIPRKVFDWRAELALTGRRAPGAERSVGAEGDRPGAAPGAPAWWVDL